METLIVETAIEKHERLNGKKADVETSEDTQVGGPAETLLETTLTINPLEDLAAGTEITLAPTPLIPDTTFVEPIVVTPEIELTPAPLVAFVETSVDPVVAPKKATRRKK